MRGTKLEMEPAFFLHVWREDEEGDKEEES